MSIKKDTKQNGAYSDFSPWGNCSPIIDPIRFIISSFNFCVEPSLHWVCFVQAPEIEDLPITCHMP